MLLMRDLCLIMINLIKLPVYSSAFIFTKFAPSVLFIKVYSNTLYVSNKICCVFLFHLPSCNIKPLNLAALLDYNTLK